MFLLDDISQVISISNGFFSSITLMRGRQPRVA